MMSNLQQAVQWISVDEELPYQYRNVLLAGEYSVIVGYYNPEMKRFASRQGSSRGFVLTGVTHWMEYPMPPAGECDEDRDN
jgi:hypothetical protein